MAKNTNSKQTKRNSSTDHNKRRQQIIFTIFAVVLIISWIASMISVL